MKIIQIILLAKAQSINSGYNSNNDLSPGHFQAINDWLELMARVSAKDHQLLLAGHQSLENALCSEHSQTHSALDIIPTFYFQVN